MLRLLTGLAACALSAININAQNDPGPRGGPPKAGSYYSSLNATEQAFFNAALQVFNEVDSVSGNLPGEAGSGLGPTFNGNSCAMCHAQPSVGGSSPGLISRQNPVPNPQVALATLDGATNIVPPFISPRGPVQIMRLIRMPDGKTPDGGVHGLFTIAGRRDAAGCNLQQPDFAREIANRNVAFRIPTPVYGLGMVENTSDATLQANLDATQSSRSALQIGGKLNTNGNDGSVTRFGWKAQNKSLLIFAGEAYNVEQGVSNELFPNERSAVSGCVLNSTPEDYTHSVSEVDPHSDLVNFAAFMRLSAPAVPTTSTMPERMGSLSFISVGCSLCHTPTLTTASSPYTGMSNSTYHPYSDFAVHHMGPNLADGITQGAAGPDEFRTAPLWGIGQRLFFLHDGRTPDLLEAILAHSGAGIDCVSSQPQAGQSCASEANAVIAKFNALNSAQKQNILNFLRSL